MADLTHVDASGAARMVDVSEKDVSARLARASGRLRTTPEVVAALRENSLSKGDALATARIAGIMAAKRTPDLIPMCHPVQINGADLTLELDEAHCSVEIQATVTCDGRTGVEMEALTAVSTAALTVYDMCKAVQKDMRITNIHLLEKSGGKSGDYRAEE